jgi:hypothetical protein
MIVINQKVEMIVCKLCLAKNATAETFFSGQPLARDSIPIGDPIDNPTGDPIDDADELPELPYDVRLNLTHKVRTDSHGELSIKEASRTFGVNYSTL